jgi:hypothetical protein
MKTTIPAWSYSRLQVFEQCKFRAFLAFVEKIPEPERPLPPGKTEHANDRGSRIHDAAELFVSRDITLIPELQNFEEEFFRLRELYREGKVSLEGEWAIDRDWNPTNWRSPEAWGRIKLDALVHMSSEHAVVVDYKTGKLYGNEIKHAEQGQLYQLAAFLRYPELQHIDVEFWYTDINEITHIRYRRDQGVRFFNGFNQRAIKMTEAKDFPPSPNIFSCKWCPYGPKGSGHCTVGV